MNIIWKRTTEQWYEESLGCLPPLQWNTLGFLVGEPYSYRQCSVTGNGAQTWTAFACIDNQYYTASEPITVGEWRTMNRDQVLNNLEAAEEVQ